MKSMNNLVKKFGNYGCFRLLAHIFIIGLLLFNKNIALAEDPPLDIGGGTGGGLKNPLKYGTFSGIFGAIADFLLLVATPILAIMLLYGGYQMMFAGGDPEKFKSGKTTILYATLGFAIILIAKGAEAIIKSVMGI